MVHCDLHVTLVEFGLVKLHSFHKLVYMQVILFFQLVKRLDGRNWPDRYNASWIDLPQSNQLV